jgi:hypothetical protein
MIGETLALLNQKWGIRQARSKKHIGKQIISGNPMLQNQWAGEKH